jgi:hypothetical protein
MITDQEILEALAAGIQIIPFAAYSQYDRTGNLSRGDFLGVRYVCIEAATEAVIGDGEFYLDLETSAGRPSLIGETPREAIDKYLAWRQSQDARHAEQQRKNAEALRYPVRTLLEEQERKP